MSTTTATVELLYAPAKPGNPFDSAKRALIAQLARLPVPHIDVTPGPEQLEAVADFVRSLAAYADVCMRAIGKEVASNSITRVDQRDFESPFTDAVEGFATATIERAAEALAEEYGEVERAQRGVFAVMVEG